MRIVVFNSSPRASRGNTHAIVKEFAAGAEAAGAVVENVFLVDKKIKPCTGCFGCWRNGRGACVIDDDMAGLLALLTATDVAVFATPLYADNVSGIMKLFMDRLIPLLDPHFELDSGGECRHLIRDVSLKSKKFVVISNSGFPEQSQFQVLRLLFRRLARNSSSELVGEIYRGGGELFGAKNAIVYKLLETYCELVRSAGRELVETGYISEATSAELEKEIVPRDLYIEHANRWWDAEIRRAQR